ncbi:MAG: hypothetical protein AAF750_02880 [Planctomycetota bacterium]
MKGRSRVWHGQPVSHAMWMGPLDQPGGELLRAYCGACGEETIGRPEYVWVTPRQPRTRVERAGATVRCWTEWDEVEWAWLTCRHCGERMKCRVVGRMPTAYRLGPAAVYRIGGRAIDPGEGASDG